MRKTQAALFVLIALSCPRYACATIYDFSAALQADPPAGGRGLQPARLLTFTLDTSRATTTTDVFTFDTFINTFFTNVPLTDVADGIPSTDAYTFETTYQVGGFPYSNLSLSPVVSGLPSITLEAVNSGPPSYTYLPIATGTGTAISFFIGTRPVQNSDNYYPQPGTLTISLDSSSTPVPEPSTWAIIFASIGMMGLFGRRGRRHAHPIGGPTATS